VAADLDSLTYGPYMEGVQGIPHAFVVDKMGKIAWTGHPMGEMENVLEQLIAGTYDPEKARALEKARQAMQSAARKQDVPGSIDAAKKMLEIDPNSSEAFQMLVFLCQHTKDPAKFKKISAGLIERPGCGAQMLNFIAWNLVSINPLSFRDVGLALRAVNRALEQEEHPGFLDTLARVYFELGRLDLAVATQEKALRASPESDRAMFESVLDYYRSVKTIAKQTPFGKAE
jgi:tetratricopeptide (TPR) repeat protein